ncbi:hypothetical protein [Burkholderia phage BCSR129]|nr:hypothetical protein [Burkholderia phage BCSR129]
MKKVKNICHGCKYADWDRTKAGSLHPNGGGRCVFPDPPLPDLPAVKSWGWGGNPRVTGWSISRHNAEPQTCNTFEPVSK